MKKDGSGKEVSTKTETKEVMPQEGVDYDEAAVDMDVDYNESDIYDDEVMD